MLDEVQIAVLERLLQLTKQGRLVWQSDEQLDFIAPLSDTGPMSCYGHLIAISRIQTEVVGRAGCDLYQLHLEMPGWGASFPLSPESEGCRRLCDILEAGGHPMNFESGSAREALELLNTHPPE